MLDERRIAPEWIATALAAPAWTEPDPGDPDLLHRVVRIAAFGDRVLRVVATRSHPPRVVTAFFDRSLRNHPI